MKIALLSLALLGQPAMIPISDKVPVLNVEAGCKATEDEAKAQGLTAVQSFSDCMKVEKEAQQQLSTLWATSPSDVRNQCAGTASSTRSSIRRPSAAGGRCPGPSAERAHRRFASSTSCVRRAGESLTG